MNLVHENILSINLQFLDELGVMHKRDSLIVQYSLLYYL